MYYPNIIDNIIFKFIYINIIILIFVYMFDFFNISRSSRLFNTQISITEYQYHNIDIILSIPQYQLNNSLPSLTSSTSQNICQTTSPYHTNKYQINNYST